MEEKNAFIGNNDGLEPASDPIPRIDDFGEVLTDEAMESVAGGRSWSRYTFLMAEFRCPNCGKKFFRNYEKGMKDSVIPCRRCGEDAVFIRAFRPIKV